MPNFDYEIAAVEQGYKTIAGVDEAGRGCLAGPVVAAAVVLPVHSKIEGLDDSKKIAPKKRELLFKKIIEECVCYGIAEVSAADIDRINIRNAAFLAMRRALDELVPEPEFVLVDGNAAKFIDIAHKCIVGGDSLSTSIAAASILAKVHRDMLMCRLDEVYPQYGFAKHKGYATKEHYKAIAEFCICDEHRRSFRLE